MGRRCLGISFGSMFRWGRSARGWWPRWDTGWAPWCCGCVPRRWWRSRFVLIAAFTVYMGQSTELGLCSWRGTKNAPKDVASFSHLLGESVMHTQLSFGLGGDDSSSSSSSSSASSSFGAPPSLPSSGRRRRQPRGWDQQRRVGHDGDTGREQHGASSPGG